MGAPSGWRDWITRAAKQRPRAFELIEYLLYLYATYVFASGLYGIATERWSRTGWASADTFANITIAAFVVYVFLRNYFVMHAIDNRRHREPNEFPFVDGNSGLGDLTERLLRAAIVFTVIATPKDVIGPISGSVSYLTRQFVAGAANFMSLLGYHHPEPDVGNQALTALFPYYGTLLAVLFVLFILWDAVNVLTWSGSRGAPKSPISDFREIDDQSTPYWMLRYYALIAPRGGNHGGAIAYEDPLVGEAPIKAFNKGSMLRFYLASPKLRERLWGLIASAAIIFVFASNYDPVCVAGFIAAVLLYYLYAHKNRRSVAHLLTDLVQFAFSYLLLRPKDQVRRN